MRKLNPNPAQNQRARVSERIRNEAAKLSRNRLSAPIDQRNNQESEHLDPPVTSFSKSMNHDEYGIVNGPELDYMISQINQDGTNGEESPFLGTYTSKRPAVFDIQLFSGEYNNSDEKGPRTWESPLSGHIYELEGPDPDAVAMPPAPKLGSSELTAEMADLYAMALCRDIPFADIENGNGKTENGQTVKQLVKELNKLPWNNKTSVAGQQLGEDLSERECARRDAHLDPSAGKINLKTLFRGSTPGAQTGPYISQFFLIGTPDRDDEATNPASYTQRTQPVSTKIASEFIEWTRGPASESGKNPGGVADLEVKDGFIRYGQQLINQRILPQKNRLDYMSDWGSWLDVQNGANRKGKDKFGYMAKSGAKSGAKGSGKGKSQSLLPEFGRFIHSPRDLATFVHFDELYQAYHNAMLILLGLGAKTDVGLPEGPGHRTRDSFATFGGPHILTLMPEVATRALKAVRRQKYQIHLRARPEAIGGVLALASHPTENVRLNNGLPLAEKMLAELNATLLPDWIKAHNKFNNKKSKESNLDKGWITDEINLLLSQAFPEGSPVHGSYGAGHATVAGACTTILKAFFEMYNVDVRRGSLSLNKLIHIAPHQLFPTETEDRAIDLKDLSEAYYVTGDDHKGRPGGALHEWDNGEKLSVEGELDKLAANVSIGRNFGGVHYYTDYYESLRMGERIAVGMLQEQMLTYREPVSMRFTSFDGDKIMITGTGGSRDLDDAIIHIWERDSGDKLDDISEWWNRCLIEA